MLIESAVKYRGLKSRGIFFEISSIQGIGEPDPSSWQITHVSEFKIDLNSMGFLDKGKTVAQFNISKNEIDAGIATVTGPIKFVHNGDEFIWLKVENQPIAIRWSMVESYVLE